MGVDVFRVEVEDAPSPTLADDAVPLPFVDRRQGRVEVETVPSEKPVKPQDTEVRVATLTRPGLPTPEEVSDTDPDVTVDTRETPDRPRPRPPALVAIEGLLPRLGTREIVAADHRPLVGRGRRGHIRPRETPPRPCTVGGLETGVAGVGGGGLSPVRP